MNQDQATFKVADALAAAEGMHDVGILHPVAEGRPSVILARTTGVSLSITVEILDTP